MREYGPSLQEKIARLGAGLAGRENSVKSDIVVETPKNMKPRTRIFGVYLNANDMALLNDLETWARQNGLRVGWGALLKAGARSIRKNDADLHVLRQVLENDGRRRV